MKTPTTLLRGRWTSHAIRLDANGLPIGHIDALGMVTRELVEFINELPESVYHLNQYDAEMAAQRMIDRYLFVVRQRGSVQLPEETR